MRKLAQWVKRVSPQLEFWIVVVLAFGYFIAGSLLYFGDPSPVVRMTGEHLIFLMVYESLVLLALGWFLKQRGWTLATLGLIPSWKSTLWSMGLLPAFYLLYAVLWIPLLLVLPEVQTISQSRVLVASDMTLWQVILISMLNPIYEEIFVCGYVIAYLKKSKPLWFAVAVSTGIRTLYHLYQPLQGIVGIVAIGLVFGVFYAKTSRLWSIVLIHALLDFVGLIRLYYSTSGN